MLYGGQHIRFSKFQDIKTTKLLLPFSYLLIFLICPSHTGIRGNEQADEAKKKQLQKKHNTGEYKDEYKRKYEKRMDKTLEQYTKQQITRNWRKYR